MLKTYHKETKLFELSQDLNREELKIRKNDAFCNALFAMALLQWLSWNDFVTVALLQWISLQWLLLLPFAYIYEESYNLS